MHGPLSKPSVVQFRPLLKRTIWGGRRLGQRLGKPIGDGDDFAESWEVVDHGADQSVVDGGPLDGKTLSELLRDDPAWLLGDAAGCDRFPLLLKYLDCHRVLSVQVHPDDQYARQMTPPDLGKTEAWYVVESDPQSRIFAGLRPGVSRDDLADAVREGRTEEVLHSFHPEPGDCVFIPAGTVHALGEGLLVCEIQQSSDTTFRLFDWNRVGPDGNRRPLHVEESLEVTDYRSGPVSPQPKGIPREGWRTLVDCDRFVLRSAAGASPNEAAGASPNEAAGASPNEAAGASPTTNTAAISRGSVSLGGDGRFHLLTVPEGSAELAWPDGSRTLARGGSALIPAGAEAGTVSISPGGVVLATHLP